MGIRDHPIVLRLPWQNGHAERLIGSIRRECLDHIVILGEGHLRRILKAYAAYYSQVRPHLSFAKDAPLHRLRHANPGRTSSRLWPDVVFGRNSEQLDSIEGGKGRMFSPVEHPPWDPAGEDQLWQP